MDRSSSSTRGVVGKVLGIMLIASLLSGPWSSRAPSAEPEIPASKESAAAPTATQPAVTESAKREAWRATMSRIPTPKGCFAATYPNTEWQEVPCTAPPNRPYPPADGGRPNIVGNGNDFVAQSSGTISSAVGSFDSVTGVTSLSDPGGVSNFALQLNTNTFPNSNNNVPACNGAANQTACQGWQQFIYSNGGCTNGAGACAFMQYWLINYDANCPSGWNTYTPPNTQTIDCYLNSANGASVPAQQISALADLTLTGQTAGGTDTVIMSTGTTLSIAAGQDSVLNLASNWQEAEFNVVGDCCGTQANFNIGPTLVVRTEVTSRTTSAPTCVNQGFTGETNNLTLELTTCISTAGAASNIVFTESYPADMSWKLAGNTAGFGQVADGRPFWVGNFDGQAGTEILFYYPGDKNWWLGRFNSSGTLTWNLAGNTAGFGQVADGRPFWVGNFDGQGRTDILFYYPGDKNWWLGRFNSSGTLTWNLAGNTAGFGQVADGRPFWVGNFDGQGRTDILFYYPGDMNWWLGSFDNNGVQSWKLIDNTAGFGQVADGRPFWVGTFYGRAGDDILFYYPGDKNWWLGNVIQLLTPGSSAGQIANGNGGCLDLPNGDTTDGNLLHIWQCDLNGLNQTWYVDGAGSIHYAVNPLKCVDFPSQHLDSSGNPIDETQLQIWDCNGATGPDQVWKFSSAGQIEFAKDTAKCVELRDGSSANNTPVQIFDCNGTSGQMWSLWWTQSAEGPARPR
jgi:hypothetical protein